MRPTSIHGILQWLFGERKTSFRAGYGVGYDSYFNNITSNAAAAAPNNLSVVNTSPILAGAAPVDRRELEFSASRHCAGAIAATKPEWNRQGPRQSLLPALVLHHPTRTVRRLAPRSRLRRIEGHETVRDRAVESTRPCASLRRCPCRCRLPQQGRVDPLQGSRSIRTNGGHLPITIRSRRK